MLLGLGVLAALGCLRERNGKLESKSRFERLPAPFNRISELISREPRFVGCLVYIHVAAEIFH